MYSSFLIRTILACFCLSAFFCIRPSTPCFAVQFEDIGDPFGSGPDEESIDPFSGLPDHERGGDESFLPASASDFELTPELHAEFNERISNEALRLARSIVEQHKRGELTDRNYPCRSTCFHWENSDTLDLASTEVAPQIRSVTRHAAIQVSEDVFATGGGYFYQHMIEFNGRWYRNGRLTSHTAITGGLPIGVEHQAIIKAAKENRAVPGSMPFYMLESGLYFRSSGYSDLVADEVSEATGICLQAEVVVEFPLSLTTEEPLSPVGLMRFCYDLKPSNEGYEGTSLVLVDISSVSRVELNPESTLEEHAQFDKATAGHLASLFLYDEVKLLSACEFLTNDELRETAAPYIESAFDRRSMGDPGFMALVRSIGLVGNESHVYQLLETPTDESTLPVVLSAMKNIAERAGTTYPALDAVTSSQQFEAISAILGYKCMMVEDAANEAGLEPEEWGWAEQLAGLQLDRDQAEELLHFLVDFSGYYDLEFVAPALGENAVVFVDALAVEMKKDPDAYLLRSVFFRLTESAPSAVVNTLHREFDIVRACINDKEGVLIADAIWAAGAEAEILREQLVTLRDSLEEPERDSVQILIELVDRVVESGGQ